MTEPLWKAVLPYPPTLGEQYDQRKGQTREGKTFYGKMLSPAARAFRQEVSIEVRRGHRSPPRLTGRLSILAYAMPPDEKADGSKNRNRRDLDNLLKSTLDALTKCGVILDDCLFDDTRIVRGNTVRGGRLLLAIYRNDVDASTALILSTFGNELSLIRDQRTNPLPF